MAESARQCASLTRGSVRAAIAQDDAVGAVLERRVVEPGFLARILRVREEIGGGLEPEARGLEIVPQRDLRNPVKPGGLLARRAVGRAMIDDSEDAARPPATTAP